MIAAAAVRPPTMAELAASIREEHDEKRRARLLDWYWAKAADVHGWYWDAAAGEHRPFADWYREEYEWLVAQRRRRLDRLERLHYRPALGAYRRRLVVAA